MYNNNSTIFKTSSCLSRDQLVKYQQNQLSANEKHSVEQHLTDCELCSEALEGIALLTSYAILNNTLDDVQKKYAQKSMTATTGNRQNATIVWYAAASILLLAVVSWVLNINMQKNDNRIAEVPAQTTHLKPSQPFINTDANIASDENKTRSLLPSPVITQVPPLERKEKAVTSGSDGSGDVSYSAAPSVADVDTESAYKDKEIAILTQGKSSFKEVKLKSDSPPLTAESEDIGNVETTAFAMTKNVDGYKIYDYSNEYVGTKKTALTKNGVPAKYERSDEPAKTSTWNNVQVKEISYDDFLAGALNDYKTKKYSSALNKFNLILADHPADVNALFYAALASHESGNSQKALGYLDQLDALPNKAFNQESEWHRALILLATNQKEKATVLLKKIADAAGFYAKQAEQKLQK